ncbi:36586_t:CDS:2 [Racocetra persica]|uniref:36586_t:CDS:1 n=1 Tax=Racocetra persica TaxID=160502 RepID=A0ACA9L8G8_9GLOM|nr:36586_t:CDS:2 [Racocetra persica]
MVENNDIDINVSKLDCVKEVISTAETVSNAVSAFVPIAAVATAVLKLCEEICVIYQTAQCNEGMCGILLDQVQLAEYPIKRLLRRKDASLDKEYCNNLIKFRQTLEKIKNFTKQVSQLSSFKKFITANNVKEAFDTLSKEFDTRMKILNFSTLIHNEEQRIIDQQRVDNDLNRIIDWMAKLDDKVDTKLQFAAEMINRADDKSDFKPTSIDPNLLQDLNVSVRSGKVVKKKYISQQTEVACKPIDLYGSDGTKNQKAQSLLAILEMLGDCDYFLKFYGMTKYYQPKIANFEFSRNVTSNISMDIGGRIVDVVRWLAPEKIRSSKVPYSSKSLYQQDKIIQKEFENIIKGGNLDAQVFYALAKEIRPKDRKEVIKYLTMGANNGNRDALFNLGNLLYKKDFEQGSKYLKLAAIKGHPKAIEKVKALDKRDR